MRPEERSSAETPGQGGCEGRSARGEPVRTHPKDIEKGGSSEKKTTQTGEAEDKGPAVRCPGFDGERRVGRMIRVWSLRGPRGKILYKTKLIDKKIERSEKSKGTRKTIKRTPKSPTEASDNGRGDVFASPSPDRQRGETDPSVGLLGQTRI